jgi:sulfur carrier protein ThiS
MPGRFLGDALKMWDVIVEIFVRLHYLFKQYVPDGDYKNYFPVTVDEGATIRDLVLALGMEKKDKRLIFVDGKRSKEENPLKEGERVAIFPPITGG